VSVELLELAADALGNLVPEVVFLGGATIPLWITDPGAPPPRPTKDVDVVVECATTSDFHEFESKLRERGFAEDQESRGICRWKHGASGLQLDAMPERGAILGFENRWQGASIPHAPSRELPSGQLIRAASPPYLVAMKLEAFSSRGGEDLLGSRDFGDVISLVDGREELVGEVRAAEPELQAFIAERIARLLAMPRIDDGLAAAVRPDRASQERVDAIIRPRLALVADPAA
jgi:hypothetical protein